LTATPASFRNIAVFWRYDQASLPIAQAHGLPQQRPCAPRPTLVTERRRGRSDHAVLSAFLSRPSPVTSAADGQCCHKGIALCSITLRVMERFRSRSIRYPRKGPKDGRQWSELPCYQATRSRPLAGPTVVPNEAICWTRSTTVATGPPVHLGDCYSPPPDCNKRVDSIVSSVTKAKTNPCVTPLPRRAL
jgi:hypothetical protein